MDLSLLRFILNEPKDKLKLYLENYFKTLGFDVTVDEKFIYCKKNKNDCLNVMLTAHMDTVYEAKEDRSLFFEQKKKLFWSPDGLGADDRAGVFAIIEIVKYCNVSDILFCDFEETGGIGSLNFCKKYKKENFNVNFILAYDRCGNKNFVTYSCDNKEFDEVVKKFGFEKQNGSFSDLANLMPHLEVSGANLSVGFENAHSTREILTVDNLLFTIDASIKLLLSDYAKIKYDYIKEKVYYCRDTIYKENKGTLYCPIFLIKVKNCYNSGEIKCIECEHKFFCSTEVECNNRIYNMCRNLDLFRCNETSDVKILNIKENVLYEISEDESLRKIVYGYEILEILKDNHLVRMYNPIKVKFYENESLYFIVCNYALYSLDKSSGGVISLIDDNIYNNLNYLNAFKVKKITIMNIPDIYKNSIKVIVHQSIRYNNYENLNSIDNFGEY